MKWPLVSRGRYEDMRERALNAEDRLDSFLDQRNMLERSSPSSVSKRIVPEQVQEVYEDPLPPPVEDALKMRVPHGSNQEYRLRSEAREAIERLGPDFDADAYADNILTGTRVKGWPL